MTLIKTALKIEFGEIGDREELFAKEFESFSETDSDPLSQWLKRAKARSGTEDMDQITMHLLVQLHKKVDELTKLVKNEHDVFLGLNFCEYIDGCWYTDIMIESGLFVPQRAYYARINMPIFPQRIVPLYLEGVDAKTAKIVKMHERDRHDWDAYLITKEREQIMDMRSANDA